MRLRALGGTAWTVSVSRSMGPRTPEGLVSAQSRVAQGDLLRRWGVSHAPFMVEQRTDLTVESFQARFRLGAGA